MKITSMQSLCTAVVLGATLVSGTASATNGYFAHGYGTTQKGLAGAGSALGQDTLAAATNPASMVDLGNRMDIGLEIFSPRRSYTVTGNPTGFPGTFGLAPGSVDSDSEYFPIPSFGYNRMLDANTSIGISVYGNGGMNTDYPANVNGTGVSVFGVPTATGVDLSQLFIVPSYARKFTSGKGSWGISPIIAYQRFEATGVGSFAGFSTDPQNLSDNGHDAAFGFGARIGVKGEVSPGVTLGASYQSRIFMGEFDDYAGLFAEQGDFDIPSTLNVGLAWNTSPSTVLVFDIQHIFYGEIDAIANSTTNAAACFGGDPSSCLGGDNGAGFGWDDMTIFKLGYQWSTAGGWTWRAGISHGGQPIEEESAIFNILAPAVVETHVTFGFTKEIDSTSALNFAGMHALDNDISGPNVFEAPGAQQIELQMDQFALELSYTRNF